MLPAPQSTQDAFVQTYKALFVGQAPKNSFTVDLAAATGGFSYTSGAIVAQYTAGADAGKWVNYDATGSDGQNVPLGIIYDDYMVENGDAKTFIKVVTPSAGLVLYKSALALVTASQLPTALTAMGGRTVENGVNGSVDVVVFN